jgi:hypothetical protein
MGEICAKNDGSEMVWGMGFELVSEWRRLPLFPFFLCF